MVPNSPNVAYSGVGSQVLWGDGERVFCRAWRMDDNGKPRAVLTVLPAADHPSRSSLDRLAHEYGLKDELDGAWAVRPLELVRDAGRTMLVLEDVGGEPLDRLTCRADGGGTLLAPRDRHRRGSSASSTSAASSTRTSSRPISWSTVRPARCG